MKRSARIISGAVLALAGACAFATCPPEGETTASLRAMREAKWAAPTDDAARQKLALALADCLSAADPVLRDTLAFEGLSAWMRAGRLDETTLQQLRQRLTVTLRAAPDAEGFAQPFAALTLAEVARVDRLKPFLSAAELAGVVQAGTAYLAQVRDYRGFDVRDGWRHGVAHGADLMLQLALNPRLQPEQAEAVRSAVAAQVMAAGEQAYRYGESERLMAPVFYLARREFFDAANWQLWFEQLGARRSKGPPFTPQVLAQRHNLAAFVSALYLSVQEQGQPTQRERLLPGLRALAKALG